MPLKLYWMTAVLLLISLATRPAPGNEIVWRSIGLRGGVYDGRNDEDFKQYEGFTTPFVSLCPQWQICNFERSFIRLQRLQLSRSYSRSL